MKFAAAARRKKKSGLGGDTRENIISHLHHWCIICISWREGAVCSHDGEHTEDCFKSVSNNNSSIQNLLAGLKCPYRLFLFHILNKSLHNHTISILCNNMWCILCCMDAFLYQRFASKTYCVDTYVTFYFPYDIQYDLCFYYYCFYCLFIVLYSFY